MNKKTILSILLLLAVAFLAYSQFTQKEPEENTFDTLIALAPLRGEAFTANQLSQRPTLVLSWASR